jgi:hypothetical protein
VEGNIHRVAVTCGETALFHLCSFLRKKTPGPESAGKLHRPRGRRLSTKSVPTFAERGCHVVSVTDPYDRNLVFLDRSRYISLQVRAPQLYSVDLFQTHYFSENLVAPGIEPGPLDV